MQLSTLFQEYSISTCFLNYLTNSDIFCVGLTSRELYQCCRNVIKLPTVYHFWHCLFQLFCRSHPSDPSQQKIEETSLYSSVVHKKGIELKLYTSKGGLQLVVQSIFHSSLDLKYCYFVPLQPQQMHVMHQSHKKFQELQYNHRMYDFHLEFIDPMRNVPSKMILFDFSQIDDLKICVHNRTEASHIKSTLLDILQRLNFHNTRPYNYIASPLMDLLQTESGNLIDNKCKPVVTHFCKHLYFIDKSYSKVIQFNTVTNVRSVFSNNPIMSQHSDFCVINDNLICAKYSDCKITLFSHTNIGAVRSFTVDDEMNLNSYVICIRCVSRKYLLAISVHYYMILDLTSPFNPFVVHAVHIKSRNTLTVMNSFVNYRFFQCNDDSFFLQYYHKGEELFKKIDVTKFDEFINSIE